MTNHDEQMKAVARLVSGRPDWIDAPAVQAWHRSDGRTEHDGTPGKPCIWSPDYRTTERWSTPSLRNVHWSDLVDVVPLVAPAGSYTRTDEGAHIGPEGETDWHGLYLSENRRAEKAERERDEARADLAEYVQAQTFRAVSRPLTPDASKVTRVVVIGPGGSEFERWGVYTNGARIEVQDDGRTLKVFPAEPPARPEGAEDIEAAFGTWERSEYLHAALDEDDLRSIANHIAEEMNR